MIETVLKKLSVNLLLKAVHRFKDRVQATLSMLSLIMKVVMEISNELHSVFHAMEKEIQCLPSKQLL